MTNFVFTGCAYTVVNGVNTLDKFNAEVNGMNFLFKKAEDYKAVEKKLKDEKGCLLTSEAIVEVSNTKTDKANSAIFNIIELLSLATRNFVSPIYEDRYSNGVLVKTVLNPVLTMNYNPANDLINTRNPNPCTLKIFLESTYDKYQEYKDSLGLNSVIHLYLISQYAVFTESKFLLGVVSLESLSSHFEEYLKGKGKNIKPSQIGRTRKNIAKILKEEKISIDADVLEKIVNSIAYPFATFNDKLIALLRSFNVKYESKDLELINNIRNRIVHDGKFPETIDSRQIDPHDEEGRLVYFLDRILLSVLDYKNKPFLNIMNGYKEEILQE